MRIITVDDLFMKINVILSKEYEDGRTFIRVKLTYEGTEFCSDSISIKESD